MSEVLYEASPSMVRMNPLGAVAVILLFFVGLLLALPPVASPVAAMVGLAEEQGKLVSVFGMVVGAVALLVLLGWYAKTKIDHLVIKEDELVWTHGLLSKQYTEIHMSKVRTVRVAQSLMQRIMGAGDIAVFTSGDEPEVVIRGLPYPDRVREIVKGESQEDSS